MAINFFVRELFIYRYLRLFLSVIMLSVAASSFEVKAFNCMEVVAEMSQDNSFNNTLTVGLLTLAVPAAVLGVWGIDKLCKKFCLNGDEEIKKRAKSLGLKPEFYENLKNVSKVNEKAREQEELESKEITKDSVVMHFNFENAQTFSQWVDKCKKLPKFAEAKLHSYADKALTGDEFMNALAGLLEILGKSSINNKDNWVAEKLFEQEDFSLKNCENFEYRDIPDNKIFAQRLDLPKDTKLHIHADIHGDIQSLVVFLSELYAAGVINENFEIKDGNYIAFLGDYVDRGCYGAEVLYTIFRLKAANPEKAILLRGNHEDIAQNMRCGFIKHEQTQGSLERYGEMILKLGIKNPNYTEYLLTKLYNCLPSAVFVGCSCVEKDVVGGCKDYALLCHGGIEKYFDPCLLFEPLESNCKYLAIKGFMPNRLGFLWNDFCLKEDGKDSYNSGRGLVVSKETTMGYLKKISSEKKGYKVSCIIRGHEHAGDMYELLYYNNGIYNTWAGDNGQWDGKNSSMKFNRECPVWVLNACPDLYEGDNCDYDVYATLKFSGRELDDWSLEPHNVKVS